MEKKSANILERYDRPFEYAGVLMSLFLAYQYIVLWFYPENYSIVKLTSFAILMAFEFIMIHSGVFMSVLPKKWSLYIFVPIYGLSALAFNVSVEDNVVLYSYLIECGLLFLMCQNNMRFRSQAQSVTAALIYFFLIMFLVMGNGFVPKFGLDTNFLTTSGYLESLTTGGLFVDSPHVAVCFGFIYYVLMTLSQYFFINKDFSYMSKNKKRNQSFNVKKNNEK